MFIKVLPKPGITVRHEVTGQPIPESGADVPNTTYYRRRIKDGDLLEQKPADKKVKPTGDEK